MPRRAPARPSRGPAPPRECRACWLRRPVVCMVTGVCMHEAEAAARFCIRGAGASVLSGACRQVQAQHELCHEERMARPVARRGREQPGASAQLLCMRTGRTRAPRPAAAHRTPPSAGLSVPNVHGALAPLAIPSAAAAAAAGRIALPGLAGAGNSVLLVSNLNPEVRGPRRPPGTRAGGRAGGRQAGPRHPARAGHCPLRPSVLASLPRPTSLCVRSPVSITSSQV